MDKKNDNKIVSRLQKQIYKKRMARIKSSY